MTPWIVLMATATVGVDQGWQPIAGGGYEYIIQIEPETLDSIKSGRDLFFHLPPALDAVRGYRITSGNVPLPHNGEPLPVPIAQATKTEAPGGPRLGAVAAKGIGADEKATPGAMTPEPGSRPLTAQETGNQQASGVSASPVAASVALPESAAGAAPNAGNQDGGSPSDELPRGFDAAGDMETKPLWMSLNGALMVLFASVGVNLFLGWVTLAQRGRYRSVLARLAVR